MNKKIQSKTNKFESSQPAGNKPAKKLIYTKRGVFEVEDLSQDQKAQNKSSDKKSTKIKPSKKRAYNAPKSSNEQSLSKYIALAGVCSRRKATEIIKDGSVTVNGKVVKEPGYKVLPNDNVQSFGKLVRQEEKVYILLNKPKDYITTVSDEKGRKTVMELISLPYPVRLYPVGRLDRATTGLLVLTNDGDLALKLSHPRYEISKTYQVTLHKPVAQGDLSKMANQGIDLEDEEKAEHVNIDAAAYVPGSGKKEVMVELHSGKYRIVRRMFEALGYDVKKLDRVAYAGLTKQGLRSGAWRYLDNREVNTLKKLSSK